jgi:hypothetical protein
VSVEYLVVSSDGDMPKGYVRIGKKGEWSGENGALLWAALHFWDEPRLMRLENASKGLLDAYTDFTNGLLEAPSITSWIDVVQESRRASKLQHAAASYARHVHRLVERVEKPDDQTASNELREENDKLREKRDGLREVCQELHDTLKTIASDTGHPPNRRRAEAALEKARQHRTTLEDDKEENA